MTDLDDEAVGLAAVNAVDEARAWGMLVSYISMCVCMYACMCVCMGLEHASLL